MAATPEPTVTPRRVAILGGGVAGWTAALALARALGGTGEVSVIEPAGPDESLGPFGAAEASLPAIVRFHSRLGVDEEGLVREAKASFGVGAVYTGWHEPGQSYMLPFGDIGASFGPVAFHQLVGRSRAEGAAIRLADYSMAALCAQAGRFSHPSADPRSVLSAFEYGLHLDLPRYATILRAMAQAAGAIAQRAQVHEVQRSAAGSIAALHLSSGDTISADLFVDCSGVAARLIGEFEPFESWDEWLLCDSAVPSTETSLEVPPLFVHSEAQIAGWRRSISTQFARHDLSIFCSAETAEDRTGLLPAIRFRNGRRRRAWSGNCVAIGAAAGLLEPIDPMPLHLLHRQVERLVSLLPSTPNGAVEAAEFNRLTAAELERARDAAILRYKTNARVGEAFWDRARAMEVPAELAWKIELYRSRGRLALYDEEVLEEAQWIVAMDEGGVRPHRYDVLADAIDADALSAHFARLRTVMIAELRTLPSHGDYLRHMIAGGQ